MAIQNKISTCFLLWFFYEKQKVFCLLINRKDAKEEDVRNIEINTEIMLFITNSFKKGERTKTAKFIKERIKNHYFCRLVLLMSLEK